MYVLSEVSGNWNRADMLKGWMNYGGVLIMGYALYRNLSQCLRIKSKKQKQIFKQALVDPGLFYVFFRFILSQNAYLSV